MLASFIPAHIIMGTSWRCGAASPTFLIFGAWTMFQNPIVESLVQSSLPDSLLNTGAAEMSLIMNDIRNLASGQHHVG